MTATPELVVVGDYAWDVLIRTNSPLQTGGDVFGEVQLAPGGSAANTAVWARRCGLEVRFVGKIGNDSFGQLAVEELRAEGLAADWLRSDAHLTGSVAVWIDQVGERSMVSGKGADHYLLPSELPVATLRAAKNLHLHGWSFFGDPPRAAARRAAALAREGGGRVSFDPGSFQMISQMGVAAFLDQTTDLGADLIFPNLEEGQVLSGERDPEEICARLHELYRGALVVLKLDEAGCYVYENGVGTYLGAASARLVDSTGAGDSFAGAFLAAWLQGAAPVAAAELANRVSAWVVERVGARPRPDEALAALLAGAARAWRPER